MSPPFMEGRLGGIFHHLWRSAFTEGELPSNFPPRQKGEGEGGGDESQNL
jgi:hypothetical protein